MGKGVIFSPTYLGMACTKCREILVKCRRYTTLAGELQRPYCQAHMNKNQGKLPEGGLRSASTEVLTENAPAAKKETGNNIGDFNALFSH